MQKNHISKILAIGIICLYIGVGINPAFAADLNTSYDSSTTISKNDTLNDVPVNEMTTYEEIYENKNCLVSFKASNSGIYADIFAGIIAIIYILTGFIIGNFYFGNYIYVSDYPSFRLPSGYDSYPANGWIHTKGSMGKWTYEGKFWGQLYPEYSDHDILYCIGVKGSIGRYSRVSGYFIGFASHVKIGPKKPESI